MSDLQTQTFDYQSLDAETRIVVQQKTGEIKTLVRRTAQDIIDIGTKLIDVKDRLGHGHFGKWLRSEFGWDERTAQRFINVGSHFKSDNLSDLSIAPSALYLLAAPSTPDEAREEALQRAANGESIGHKDAKSIVDAHKPPKPHPFPGMSHTAWYVFSRYRKIILTEDGTPAGRGYQNHINAAAVAQLLSGHWSYVSGKSIAETWNPSDWTFTSFADWGDVTNLYAVCDPTAKIVYAQSFAEWRAKQIAQQVGLSIVNTVDAMRWLLDGYTPSDYAEIESKLTQRFTPPDMSDIADVPGDDDERGITREEYEAFEDDNDGFDDEDDYDDSDAEYPGGFDDDDDETEDDAPPPAPAINLKPERFYLWVNHREAATAPLHVSVCIMSFDQMAAAERWAQDVLGFVCSVYSGRELADYIRRQQRAYTIMKMEAFVERFGRKPQPTQTPILVGAPRDQQPLTDQQMGDEILSRLHMAGIWDGKMQVSVHALTEVYREVVSGYPVTALIPVKSGNNALIIYLPKYAPAPQPPARDPMMTSDSDEWYTPKHIIDAVLKALGGEIFLDPCSNDPRPNVPARMRYTKADDGLNQDWVASTVYMNPPFSLVEAFTSKLVEEYEAGRIREAITLVAARTDTAWMRRLAPYPRCFITGRLRFLSPDGEVHNAPYPSVAIYLGTDLNRFAEAFESLGDIYIMWR